MTRNQPTGEYLPLFAVYGQAIRRAHIVKSIEPWDPKVVRQLQEMCPGEFQDEAKMLDAYLTCRNGAFGRFEIADCETEDQFCDHCLLADLGPAVYRIYDILENLIYVGSTDNPLERMAAHRRNTWWWHYAADWKNETQPDLATARRVEAEVIASENPRYNIQGRTTPTMSAVGGR